MLPESKRRAEQSRAALSRACHAVCANTGTSDCPQSTFLHVSQPDDPKSHKSQCIPISPDPFPFPLLLSKSRIQAKVLRSYWWAVFSRPHSCELPSPSAVPRPSPSPTPASRLPIAPVLQSTPAIQPAPHHLLHPPNPQPHNLLAQVALLCSPLDSACRPQLHPSLHTRIPNFASTQTFPACCRSRSVSCHPPFCRRIQLQVDLRCYRPRYPHPRDYLRRGASQHPACHTNITHSRPWSTHRVKAHHGTNYFLIYFLLSAAATQFLSSHRQLPHGHDRSQQLQVHPACQNTPLISSLGSLKDPQPPRFPPRTLSPRFFRLLLRLKTRLQAVRALRPRSALTQRLSLPPINLIFILPRHLTTRDQILLPPGSRAPGGRMTGVLEL